MNVKQRVILIIVALTIIAMLIYPPFSAQLPAGAVQSLGYSWLFAPPMPQYPYTQFTGTVDLGVLVVQWLGVLLAGAIAWLVAKD